MWSLDVFGANSFGLLCCWSVAVVSKVAFFFDIECKCWLSVEVKCVALWNRLLLFIVIVVLISKDFIFGCSNFIPATCYFFRLFIRSCPFALMHPRLPTLHGCYHATLHRCPHPSVTSLLHNLGGCSCRGKLKSIRLS